MNAPQLNCLLSEEEVMEKWNKLDNAAKIFPATIEQSETRVFRFYCELTEDVRPDILQQAVELAVVQLPQFLKILRTGLFWYYLENTNLKPIVKEECQTPCSHIYRYGHQDLLFNVTYYKKRINLEVFHVLADGAGAIQFLKFILAAYINILYPGTLPLDDPLLKNTVAVEDMDVDSFSTYYTGGKNPRKIKKSWVWRLHGKRRPELDLNVTEGVVSVKQVLALAHEHHATMTEFLVAVFIKAIILQLNALDLKKTLVIDVPINLRNYFPSETTRNFFVMMPIEYRPTSRDDSIQMICESISQEFAKIITLENLAGRINSYGAFERLIPMRLVPLFLKDPGLRFINFVTKRFITGCVSNLGKVTLPEPLNHYVNQWGVYSSTLNIQAECISFKDRLTIGITEAFYDVTVIYTFFELLKNMGIEAEIHTNTPAVIHTIDTEISSASAAKPGDHLSADEPCRDRLSATEPKPVERKKYWADPTVKREAQPSDVFPVPKAPSHEIRSLLKLVNILFILLVIVYAFFYIATGQQYDGFIVLCINTFFMWHSVVSGTLNKKSVLRKLFISFAWTSAIYLFIDIFTGWNQWSVSIQVPIFAFFNIVLSLLVAYLMPTNTTRSEILLFVSWETMIGIIPFVLTLVGFLHFSLLPIAVGLICLLLLIVMMLFRWRSLKYEYTKIFHF